MMKELEKGMKGIRVCIARKDIPNALLKLKGLSRRMVDVPDLLGVCPDIAKQMIDMPFEYLKIEWPDITALSPDVRMGLGNIAERYCILENKNENPSTIVRAVALLNCGSKENPKTSSLPALYAALRHLTDHLLKAPSQEIENAIWHSACMLVDTDVPDDINGLLMTLVDLWHAGDSKLHLTSFHPLFFEKLDLHIARLVIFKNSRVENSQIENSQIENSQIENSRVLHCLWGGLNTLEARLRNLAEHGEPIGEVYYLGVAKHRLLAFAKMKVNDMDSTRLVGSLLVTIMKAMQANTTVIDFTFGAITSCIKEERFKKELQVIAFDRLLCPKCPSGIYWVGPPHMLCCNNSGCKIFDGESEFKLKTYSCSVMCGARYCCRDCQIADWKSGHRDVCPTVVKSVIVRNTINGCEMIYPYKEEEDDLFDVYAQYEKACLALSMPLPRDTVYVMRPQDGTHRATRIYAYSPLQTLKEYMFPSFVP